MDNSIYITLSRQLALFRQMEVKANNIANATTAGFGAEQMVFNQYLVDSGKQELAFVQDISTYRDLKEGNMKLTGGGLDVAIKGRGYFIIETPLGERYTRAGNFTLNADGELVTPQGYAVLDDSGQHIAFEEEDIDIKIGEAGNITVGEEERGQIGLVEFPNEQVLERVSGNLFRSDVPPLPAANSTMLQGVLEMSNVEPVRELTDVIQISRSVATTAKLIETMYDLGRKANDAYTRTGG